MSDLHDERDFGDMFEDGELRGIRKKLRGSFLQSAFAGLSAEAAIGEAVSVVGADIEQDILSHRGKAIQDGEIEGIVALAYERFVQRQKPSSVEDFDEDESRLRGIHDGQSCSARFPTPAFS